MLIVVGYVFAISGVLYVWMINLEYILMISYVYDNIHSVIHNLLVDVTITFSSSKAKIFSVCILIKIWSLFIISSLWTITANFKEANKVG